MHPRPLRPRLIVLLAATCLVGGGCGDDSSKTSSEESAKATKAAAATDDDITTAERAEAGRIRVDAPDDDGDAARPVPPAPTARTITSCRVAGAVQAWSTVADCAEASAMLTAFDATTRTSPALTEAGWTCAGAGSSSSGLVAYECRPPMSSSRDDHVVGIQVRTS